MSPMELLYDYERRVQERALSLPRHAEAGSRWSGIVFRLGEDLMLHLHGLEHGELVAFVYGIPLHNRNIQQQAMQGRGNQSAAGGTKPGTCCFQKPASIEAVRHGMLLLSGF